MQTNLPPCLTHLLERADALLESVGDSPFPEILAHTPTTDDDVRTAVLAADDYFERVRLAYGPSGQKPGLGDTSLAPTVLDCFSDVWCGPPGRMGPHQNAAELLGPVLPTLLASHTCRLRESFYGEAANAREFLKDHPFRLETWAQVGPFVRQCNFMVVSNAHQLVQWIRDGVQRIAMGFMPSITLGGATSGTRVELVVTVAGLRRETSITNYEAKHLKRLAAGEEAVAFRATHVSLLEKVPELVPWITRGSRKGRRLDENQSVYLLDPRVREQVALG